MKKQLIFVLLFPIFDGCSIWPTCGPGPNESYEKIEPNGSIGLDSINKIKTLFLYNNSTVDSIKVELVSDTTLQQNSYFVEFELEGETWDEKRIAYTRYQVNQDTLHLWVTPYDYKDEKPSALRFQACSLVDSYVKINSMKFTHPVNQNIEYNEKYYYQK